MKGTIKFYDSAKGYGFVEPEHPNQKDVYLPVEQVGTIKLQAGDKVTFERACCIGWQCLIDFG